MSNTLEETLEELLDNHAVLYSRTTKQYILDEITIEERDKEWDRSDLKTKESIRQLLLSEAHRIGMEAIGPDYIDLEGDTDPHTEITLKWMNFEKSQQHQRLSKITGVKE